MRLDGIRAVFFDAADTLFYIREGLGKTYAQPAIKYGVNPSPEELKRAFSIHFPSAPPLAFKNVTAEERKRLEKQWWYEVVRNVYEDIGMFKDFDNYFNDLFELFRSDAWSIFPETQSVLKELRNMDYKLVVVSNFDSRVYDVCRNLDILHMFDDFLISSETGYAKPSEEIFKIALERNDLEPNECVHIGDNYENDYLSPRKVGINAIFLDRENRDTDTGKRKIYNLNQLVGLLKKPGE